MRFVILLLCVMFLIFHRINLHWGLFNALRFIDTVGVLVAGLLIPMIIFAVFYVYQELPINITLNYNIIIL